MGSDIGRTIRIESVRRQLESDPDTGRMDRDQWSDGPDLTYEKPPKPPMGVLEWEGGKTQTGRRGAALCESCGNFPPLRLKPLHA